MELQTAARYRLLDELRGLDLINLRRVAWGNEKPEPQPEAPAQPEPDSALIARLTEEILKKLR